VDKAISHLLSPSNTALIIHPGGFFDKNNIGCCQKNLFLCSENERGLWLIMRGHEDLKSDFSYL